MQHDVQNYGQLLAARALVGVGEAAYAVISPTIIADLYEPEVRTHMLSIFYIAIPVGAYVIYGDQVQMREKEKKKKGTLFGQTTTLIPDSPCPTSMMDTNAGLLPLVLLLCQT